MSEILALQPSVMHYSWGKIGKSSLAFRLSGQIQDDLPYAELWYGDHPKGPSRIAADGGSSDLHSVLKKDRSLLGKRVAGKFGDLPFLAKFLSIKTALSVQCHPDLEQAALLHEKDPVNYPDKNHKPEIAVAITPVSMLHGWIDQAEIAGLKRDFPEINLALQAAGINLEDWSAATRKSLLKAVFSLKNLSQLYTEIADRLNPVNCLSRREACFLKLIKEYGMNDNGILLSFFLRLLELKPYQSIFTPSREIHAYLEGDLFECMANSDNVIRSGLTSKFQDINTLLEYGNFECGDCPIMQASPWSEDRSFSYFYSQAVEFQILLKTGLQGSIACHDNRDSAQLIVLLEGSVIIRNSNHQSVRLEAGQAAFVPADIGQFEIIGSNSSFFRVLIPD